MHQARVSHCWIKIPDPSLRQSFDKPLIDRRANKGQYLGTWEDVDWIQAIRVHSNRTLPSSGIGIAAGQV